MCFRQPNLSPLTTVSRLLSDLLRGSKQALGVLLIQEKVRTGNWGEPRSPLHSQSTPIWHQPCLLLKPLPFLRVLWTPSPWLCFLEMWMLCGKDVRNMSTISPWKTSRKTWETDIQHGGCELTAAASWGEGWRQEELYEENDSWSHCEIRGYNHLLRELLQGLLLSRRWELPWVSTTFSEEKYNDGNDEYSLCKSCFKNVIVTIASFVLWSILRSRQFYFHFRQKTNNKREMVSFSSRQVRTCTQTSSPPSQPLSVTWVLIITSLACCEISN